MQQCLLSPEQEQAAVDRVTGFGWISDDRAAVYAINDTLSIGSEHASAVLRHLIDAGNIRLQAEPANDMAESGRVRPLCQVKFERGQRPTTLELIGELTQLDWMSAPLDTTRQVLSRLCNCSIDEAEPVLSELRDRSLFELRPQSDGALSEQGSYPASRWKWFRTRGEQNEQVSN